MRATVLTLGVVVGAGLACGPGASDPTPVVPLPEGRLFQLAEGPSIGFVDGADWQPLTHGIPLENDDGQASRSPTERVMPLENGGFVFCGYGMDGPRSVAGCWEVGPNGATAVVHRSQAAPRGADPVLAAQVRPDGTWWNSRSLEYGGSWGEVEGRVSVEGDVRRGFAAPDAARWAVVLAEPCRLLVVDSAGEEQASIPLDSCSTDISWSADGRLAFLRDGEVVVWDDGAESVLVPRVAGVDGHQVETRIVDWAPSGDALLVRSSRFHPRTADGAGNRTLRMSTYVVDVTTGTWSRLERDVRPNAVWVALQQ